MPGRASPSSAAPPPRSVGVPKGPRSYRTRLRRAGAFAPLLPMAALALVGRLLLVGGHSPTRAAASLGCSVLAAPFLLVMGVPLTSAASARAVAVALSIAMWSVLGLVAAVRATRRPAVAWREYWVEFAWSGAAVWAGVVGGLVVADAVLGRPVL